MTETITKIELTREEWRERPRILTAGGMGVSCMVATTFPLLIAPEKAQEIKQLYLSNPQPQIELTVWLSSIQKWSAGGKFIGIDEHSISSAGNVVCDVTFEPDDKSTLQRLQLSLQQIR